LSEFTYNTNDWGEVLVAGLNYRGSLPPATNITEYTSRPAKGDGLVHRASGQHTMQIVTINFSGDITIEATLDRDPGNALWLPATLTDSMTGEQFTTLHFQFIMPVPGVPYSGNTMAISKFYKIIGQYAWFRAVITNISTGQVDLIKLAY